MESDKAFREARHDITEEVEVQNSDKWPGHTTRIRENLCGCCGETVGQEVDCRVWMWQGQEYTTPPKAMHVDAILRHVYGGSPAKAVKTKEVPANLKKFLLRSGKAV